MIYRRREGEMMRQGLNYLNCPFGKNIALHLWRMVFSLWYFPHRPFGQKLRFGFGWVRVFALCGVEVDVLAHAIRIDGVTISIDLLHAMTMPNPRYSYIFQREGNVVIATMREVRG